MSETGKAIETLRRCLATGDLTGGEEALERVTLRLLEVVSELAQLKRAAAGMRATEWSRELEAGVIESVAAADEPRRQPHAEERGDDAHDDGRNEVTLGDGRDE